MRGDPCPDFFVKDKHIIMTYNSDELVAPGWLSADFFLNVMRESNNDPSIVLTDGCTLRPGTNKGDHYASVMFRTTVSYRSKRFEGVKSINLIMKTKPETEGIKMDILNDNKLFAIELDMYRKTLPEMARLLAAIGEEYKYPKYIYGALEPRAILILEDISDQGWVMSDYIATLEDMKPIVKDIAMFHAASVMISSANPKFISEHIESMADLFLSFDKMIVKGFGDLLELTKLYPEFKHFAEPLENFYRNVRSLLYKVYEPSETFQNVLLHGDFHYKNMLHKIDPSTGRHKETILLDYQICSWASPAKDLYCLLDMIPTQEVKDSHRSELIYMYYRHYSELLRRMGFPGKIPSLVDLQIELLRHAGLELFDYAVFSPFRYMDNGSIDIESFLKGEMANPVLHDPEFKKLMHSELTRFLHQGTI
uniref:CHK kinase-like domain-containing protein n=1 Tax=Anopheles farauti TaxID=69004 RepID=A0A182QVY8_9DIPT